MGGDSFLMVLYVLCARVGRAVASRGSRGQASVAGEEGAVGFGVGGGGVCRSAWCEHEGHTTTPKTTNPLQEVLSLSGI